MIAWSSAAPTRPGCGRYAPVRASAVIWSPAGTSIRSTSQGREQLAVRRDGLPLQREMGAVISFRQVAQAHPGQPGQPSRRASRLHQAGDAVTVGQLGGPQQHPVPGQDPQPGRGGTAGIDQNTTETAIWPATAPAHRSGTGQARSHLETARRSIDKASAVLDRIREHVFIRLGKLEALMSFTDATPSPFLSSAGYGSEPRMTGYRTPCSSRAGPSRSGAPAG